MSETPSEWRWVGERSRLPYLAIPDALSCERDAWADHGRLAADSPDAGSWWRLPAFAKLWGHVAMAQTSISRAGFAPRDSPIDPGQRTGRTHE
jgi:hypothetical protein